MKKTPLQTFVIDGDRVEALYNEEVGMDVRIAGKIRRAEKISDVKFDAASQKWIAVDRRTRKIIARDKSRKRCVQKEHAYYEREITRGRIPWPTKKSR